MSSTYSKWWSFKFLVWLQVVCAFLLFGNAACGQIVRTLPGFPGTLPFSLETGYISVGSSELFYLFVESQGNPEVDPVLYYIVGGPGCAALNGFFFQTGPLQFDGTAFTGGLPKLQLYPHTWTKSASIIFVDAPIGSGYSYSTNPEDYGISDLQSANQSHVFIRKWLNQHPQYIKNRFFIATDSYSGVLAPIIANNILDGNNAGLEPTINLIGVISGSPRMNGKEEQSYQIILAHKLGLISKSIFNYAKEYCNGTYFYTDTSSVSAECLEYLQVIDELIEQINLEMVLAPKCSTISPKLEDGNRRRSLRQTDYWCKNFDYLLSTVWANDEGVQSALHVREGTIKEWRRCNLTFADGTYDYDVDSSFDYHKNLTKAGLQLLLYSGDHDLVVPHIYTEYWIGLLDITLDEDWRPWFVGGQVAGYTMKYSNYGYRLTYATLKGSGHSPTEWKGRDTYEMFERWIHFYPL
ncbi:serine carboxypeptidase-like 11 [Mangifera indica]|uniref:serine carboxypeptidase-like 11 n=1 Tax=Mangifera indica TaxID=29780 RepID=UPI001CF989D8|nr:serine carboxypeptidase-like 11 [Mangifera indica]